MLILSPFRALRYDTRKAGPLSKLVTPPYDIISPEKQKSLYASHPNNFIRVVYGKKGPSDRPGRNVYTRAKRVYDGWLRSGILKQDFEPGIYPYEQEYRVAGKRHRRLGAIALVRLDSTVFPHEKIFTGPKLDRLELSATLNASLDPIFGLLPDAQGSYRRYMEKGLRSRRPEASFAFEGVKHRLWRITDRKWIERLQELLSTRELVIADGHHRFQAALAYRDQRRKSDPFHNPNAPYNFVMFYLAATGSEEPGLLPTHRIVRFDSRERFKKLLAKVNGSAETVKDRKLLLERLSRLRASEKIGVGLYTGNGAGYLLKPRPGREFHLDVEWLHADWIPQDAQVSYTQDLDSAYEKVRRGQADAVFVTQPVRLKDVLDRARAERHMPRKTTYFYPKLVSGLLEYPFGG